jgi:hypothetical protein
MLIADCMTRSAASAFGSAPNNFVRMPLPVNAQNCTASTGVNFNAPPGFGVSNIAANGAANGLEASPSPSDPNPTQSH